MLSLRPFYRIVQRWSIRRRVSVLAVSSVLATATIVAVLAVREVCASAQDTAAERLGATASRNAEMIEPSALTLRSAVRALADTSSIGSWLEHRIGSPNVATLAAVVRANVAVLGAEVWDTDLRRVAASGDTLRFVGPAAREAILGAARSHMIITPLFADRGVVLYFTAMEIVRHGHVVGYIVEHRRLTTSRQGALRMQGILGGDHHLKIGNADGTLWTDLYAPVTGPSTSGMLGHLLTYHSPAGPTFAVMSRIDHTPWLIAAETPRAEALRPAYDLATRLIVLEALVVLLAATAAWLLSASVTRPIADLVSTAKAIAEGDHRQRVDVTDDKELGALGESFNLMMDRVGDTLTRLEQSEESHRELFESNPLPTWVLHAHSGAILAVNAAAVNHYGYRREQFLAMKLEELEESPAPGEGLRRIADSGAAPVSVTHVAADGRRLEMEFSAHPMAFAGTDALVAVARDVTEHRSLTAQLLHSQKMEAVGQLAGGIAHDFNNILTVISGYAEILRNAASVESQAHGDAGEIAAAAQRAALLTRQLLAFSRKQHLQPTSVDVNDAVRQAAAMMHRVLPENISVELILDDGAHPIRVDPGQLDQILLNLAVNSRDAMEHGGRLTIETRDVVLRDGDAASTAGMVAGHYSMIAVTDTGCGIPHDVQPRVFEPFFTTKEVGKGTGLGLSTVYGIVKQSGGFIWLYSEPGLGTTLKVYFPIDTETVREAGPAALSVTPAGGDERILLVEDEPGVRRLASSILERHGYSVLEAADGREALALLDSKEVAVDLMLTDMIMPGMSGPELAGRLRSISPRSAVLYMSGYPDIGSLRGLGTKAVPTTPFPLLEKPFSTSALLRAVRTALGNRN